MDSSSPQANRQIARAAGITMVAFTLSQLTGLIRTILTTKTFGTGADMDAFNAGNQVPNFLFAMVAGGALASSFVPVFTTKLARNDRKGAWQLASSLVNLVVLILIVAGLIAAFLAPQIVHLFWPHFEQAATVQLFRILLLTSVVFAASGIVSGVLNAHHHYLLPSLASSLYWVGCIIGLIFFVPRWGILGLAWGAVLGSFLHLCIQLPDLFRLPDRQYSPSLGLKNPDVREVVLLMGPRLIGVATVYLNVFLNSVIANYLLSGSLSTITYAWSIFTAPLVVIGSGIGFATLPTFSGQVARGEMKEFKDSIISTLRGLMFLSIPAAVGLILLAHPLIATIYQHKAFTRQDTDWVALALVLYSLGLVGHAALEVIVRAFYALHNTRMPVIAGVISMLTNLALSIGLVLLFGRIGWLQFGGLALATSIAAYLESGLLYGLLRKRLKGLPERNLLKGIGIALTGSAAMAAAVLLWLKLMAGQPDTTLGNALRTAGGAVVGVAVYGLILIALRVPEVHQLLGSFKRRLGSFLPQS